MAFSDFITNPFQPIHRKLKAVLTKKQRFLENISAQLTVR